MLLPSTRQFTGRHPLKKKQNCGEDKFWMLYLRGPSETSRRSRKWEGVPSGVVGIRGTIEARRVSRIPVVT